MNSKSLEQVLQELIYRVFQELKPNHLSLNERHKLTNFERDSLKSMGEACVFVWLFTLIVPYQDMIKKYPDKFAATIMSLELHLDFLKHVGRRQCETLLGFVVFLSF